MGDHIINPGAGDDARLHFISHLLSDINSLEYMLQNRLIEDDVIRVGAEQELCLVNDHWRPAKKALEVLESINDPHFTSELALYNAEINLDPLTFEGDAFSNLDTLGVGAGLKLHDMTLRISENDSDEQVSDLELRLAPKDIITVKETRLVDDPKFRPQLRVMPKVQKPDLKRL